MERVVFTNGCFDIIHKGHIELLKKAKNFGDKLIVGLNSDISVRELKGKDRPYMNQESRAAILKAIRYVDEVILFDDPSVYNLIKVVKPHILVKGGDYTIDQVVGHDIVLGYGGEVKIVDIIEGYSSTNYIKKL